MTEAEKAKAAIQSIQDSFAELKKEVPELVKQEAKGHVEPILKEKMETIDTTLSALEKRLETSGETEKALKNDIAALKAAAGAVNADPNAETELDKKSLKIFNKYLKNQELTAEDRETIVKAKAEWQKKDQIAGNDSEGGFLVRPTFTNSITAKIFETSPMRQISSVTTIGTSEWVDLYDDSEVGDEEVAETEARSETAGVLFEENRIRAHTRAAKVPISVELLDDQIINLENYLETKIQEKFARQENRDFILGDNVKTARGVLDYAASAVATPGKFGTLEDVISAAVNFNGIIDLIDSLFDPFQSNANMLMKRQTRTVVRKITDADGRFIWEPSHQRGVPPELFGVPVMTAVHLDAATGSGNVPIIFGDFRQGYQVVDRLGLRVVRDEITDERFIFFRFRRRTGGGVKQFQAIKRYKLS